MVSKVAALLSKQRKGFSIVELMVVVMIMALILAASIPALKRHTGSVTLVQASEGVAGTLRLARQRAVSTALPVVVVFGAEAGTYYLFQDSDGDGVLDAGETQAGPYELPNGIVFGEIDLDDDDISFSGTGSADESGNIVLVNRNNRAQRIIINAPTGLVYVSDIFDYGEEEG